MVTDTLTLGGATISKLEMGLGLEVSKLRIGIGTMGIGFNISEAGVASQGKPIYPNIVDTLVDDGLINTHAYSIWFNDRGT